MPENDPLSRFDPPVPSGLPDGHAAVLRDYRLLAAMRHPVKVALWLALLRPSEELFSRESLTEVTHTSPENPEVCVENPDNPEGGIPRSATTQDSTGVPNAPADPRLGTQVAPESFGERIQPNRTSQNTNPLTPELSSIPAVIAWAEAAVRKGIRGDMQAWALVADRIEGKTGTRKDEVDPEDERRRGDIQTTIESVVRALVENRLAQPGDDSLLINHTLASDGTLDSERQDSDTANARRREIAEAARREQEDNQGRGASLAETNDEPEERDLTIPDGDPRRSNGHDH